MVKPAVTKTVATKKRPPPCAQPPQQRDLESDDEAHLAGKIFLNAKNCLLGENLSQNIRVEKLFHSLAQISA